MHQVTNVINGQGEKKMSLFSIITISLTRTRIRSYNTIDPTLNEHQKYSLGEISLINIQTLICIMHCSPFVALEGVNMLVVLNASPKLREKDFDPLKKKNTTDGSK